MLGSKIGEVVNRREVKVGIVILKWNVINVVSMATMSMTTGRSSVKLW